MKDKKGRILDLGCASCRYLIAANKEGNELYGIDFSENMIKQAEKYCRQNGMKVELKQASAEELPFTDNFFDSIICIAVLHIIEKGRIEKPLSEIKRVLKPGADALISVWYKEEKGEKLKPFPVVNENVMRYYYFFEEKEIEDKIKKAGLEITKSYISGYKNRKNIFIEVRKPL